MFLFSYYRYFIFCVEKKTTKTFLFDEKKNSNAILDTINLKYTLHFFPN